MNSSAPRRAGHRLVRCKRAWGDRLRRHAWVLLALAVAMAAVGLLLSTV